MADDLLPLPLTARTIHLCLDMQRLFSPEGPWPTPWMKRVLPVVVEIAARFPERTVFTRFITPEHRDDMPGMWRRYYAKWTDTTRERVDLRFLELVPELARFSPPAAVVDKTRYSAFSAPQLLPLLQEREADGLIITGSETDVCVLSTIMSAVDFGYRVILVRDAVCSSSDEGHDALLDVYHRRYSEQVETADAQDVLSRWR
ncbi:MAG: cysteine hydrolase family protein [Variibacter sp.]